VIRNNWFKSTRLIDIMCVVLITLPFISNNICSVFAAVYAVRGDFEKAAMFTQALYYMWTIYCFLLGTLIFFAGLRLLKVLSLHLSNQEQSGINVVKLKSAIFKVRIYIYIIAIYMAFIDSIFFFSLKSLLS
jgi:hypothetical protein